jgi:hypothetical protein
MAPPSRVGTAVGGLRVRWWSDGEVGRDPWCTDPRPDVADVPEVQLQRLARVLRRDAGEVERVVDRPPPRRVFT